MISTTIHRLSLFGQLVHYNPSVFIVPNFLLDDECNRLLRKAARNMKPSVNAYNIADESKRSSEVVYCPQRDAPTIVDKIASLLNCTAGQLEILQIIRYTKGQFFKPHNDGQSGAWSSSGFVDAGRLATVFIYLIDAPNGGETNFTSLEPPSEGDEVTILNDDGSWGGVTIKTANADSTFDGKYVVDGKEYVVPGIKPEQIQKKSTGRTLSIRPKKGMAVVHFPQSLSLELDVRTMHEGGMAIDEKWILATWMCVVILAILLYTELSESNAASGAAGGRRNARIPPCQMTCILR